MAPARNEWARTNSRPAFGHPSAPRVVQPADPLGSDGDRVQQRHRPVLAGRVAERDIEECRPGLAFLLHLELEPHGLLVDPHEVASGRHIADLEPLGGRPAGDHRHAIEHDGAGRGVHGPQCGITERGLAGVLAEEQVKRDRLDGLLREDDHLFALPVVRARTEAGGLAPELRAVAVDEVDVDRVIRVDRSGHALGLAPGRRGDRQGLATG